MRNILIVDDDELFRDALKTLLTNKKYNVTEAADGKIARDLLTDSNFDLVISDIKMPHLTGVELLEWVKAYKSTKVMLMTGFSELLETKSAFERGANEFLPKPFNEKELFEKLTGLFPEDAWPPKIDDTPKPSENQFCRVPIEDFLTDKNTLYDIFIRVSEHKYIKIAHQGGKLSEDRIKTFKEKGVHYVYVLQRDFDKLVNFNLRVAKAVNASDAVNPAKKANFMKYTSELILERVFVKGVDVEAFHSAKDFISTSMNLLTEDKETFNLLEILSSHTDYIYAHSLGSSTFSVMIAKKIGWESPGTLFKLAFGGLFHDIGKKEIDRKLLEKPRVTLSQEERKLIETHAVRGGEILECLKTVPSEVIMITYEHHEDNLGQGYPRRLTEHQIHPLTKVVSMANAFCELTIPSPNLLKPMTGIEAITQLEKFKIHGFDKMAFKALKSLFPVAPT